jgi:uncharacterized protein YkwD
MSSRWLLLASALATACASGCSSTPSASSDDGGGPGGDDGAPASAVDAGAPSSGDGATGPDGASTGADAGTLADSATPLEVSAPEDASSGTVADSGPTQDELDWLTPQNAARAAVGEPPLVWDPIAAKVAQGYATSCPTFDHNPNRGTQYDAFGGMGGLGENIAAGAPTQTVAGAVGSWVGEQQYYDHATNTCASGQECGHYTQIVWKGTTGVGCAKWSCTTNSPFGTFASGQWDFSVCDYSPPGNVVGQSPY